MKTEQTLRLDGADWQIAQDPGNIGRAQEWWRGPRLDAVPTTVPGVIDGHFPDYRGVVWYWTEFEVPHNPHAGGRYLLSFADVDYLAEVWVNDVRIGAYEGAHEPFILDATAAVRPGAANRLSVRLLFPGDDPIDDIVLIETPHGCHSHWCVTGGIFDSVELLVVPAVRIADLFVRPDWRTGEIKIELTVHNAGDAPAAVSVAVAVAPACEGGTLDRTDAQATIPPGESRLELALAVAQPRLWQLNDPLLYRVTAQVASGVNAVSERSTRCGFRDFRFENGYFRLNGKRVFLKNSHLSVTVPPYAVQPLEPSLTRLDLLNMKCMGFNMVRFIATDPPPRMLDLADEIGLMVYAEPLSAWRWRSSPRMPERFDRSLSSMIRRARNHPSVVIWGLLNETKDEGIARRAEASLPLVRRLDPGRVVLLHSGRFDAPVGNYENGLQIWRRETDTMPNLIFNPLSHGIFRVPFWPARSLSLHPGAGGEHAVLRFTAPQDGTLRVRVEFRATAPFVLTSTDVHVARNGRPLYDDFINLCGRGERRAWTGEVALDAGDRLDFSVGPGAGYQPPMPTPCDAMASPWILCTQVSAVLEAADGTVYDAVAGFSPERNPHGPWSYGWRAAGARDAEAFTPFARCDERRKAFTGMLSNPDLPEWQNAVSDHHIYLRTPHRAREIAVLRTVAGGELPLHLSEYGIGSGVDFLRLLRHYERIGATRCRLFRTELEPMAAAFLGDWQRWRLDEAFAGPADFFRKSLGRMAGQRKLGLNALRSNPLLVAHSLTSVQDALHVGEGVLTAFREPKPGAFDAIADGFAPLRWCLFAEPAHIYSGAKVRLEAVLANEDQLPPGTYPVLLRVAGPDNRIVMDERVEVNIAALKPGREPPFAVPVFARDITIDGPTGQYRLLAEFEKGAAAAGEEIAFYVMNRADMPAVGCPVTLWSDDPELAGWLTEHGIALRGFNPREAGPGDVILISNAPAGGSTEARWREIESAIAAGATAVFLDPGVFARDGEPLGWLPLATKGVCECDTPELYVKDEWPRCIRCLPGCRQAA